MPLLFVSCVNDGLALSEETVQVSFCASVPGALETRGASDLTVNKVVCAVFENDVEIPALRQTLDIVSGKDPVFTPSLIKGRTYDIVFWAMKDDAYNVSDMTAIVRNTSPTATLTEADYDAFTESVEVTVTDASATAEVTLVRPFAQLNIGVTEADWNSVASKDSFGMTPKTIKVSLKGKNIYNALTGAAAGNDTSITYSLEVSGAGLAVSGMTYRSIAMCYVLPEASKENFDITFSIYAAQDKAIRENVKISSVPLESNYRTNVVGGLLTGTVSYTIKIEDSFADTSHDKTIE